MGSVSLLVVLCLCLLLAFAHSLPLKQLESVSTEKERVERAAEKSSVSINSKKDVSSKREKRRAKRQTMDYPTLEEDLPAPEFDVPQTEVDAEELAYLIEVLRELEAPAEDYYQPQEDDEPYVLVPVEVPDDLELGGEDLEGLPMDEEEAFSRNRREDNFPLISNEEEAAAAIEALDEMELAERIAELAEVLNQRYVKKK